MTAAPTLVRYVGPLAAYRGAIGWSAEGGALIGGRLRLGEVAPCSYHVVRGRALIAQRSTWTAAVAALADRARIPISADPDPAGLEVTVGESVYRLEVV